LKLRFLTAGLLFALALPAGALEYRTTSRAALLYDAPSQAGAKIAIAGSGLPLEVVVETAGWVKVRDHSGRLAWIEQSALGGAKRVMVKVETGNVRQQPRSDAEVVFRAVRGVLLDVTGDADSFGWLPVRHADGLGGWLPSHEVWGR
jgi:SH3-like domain-containing protein